MRSITERRTPAGPAAVIAVLLVAALSCTTDKGTEAMSAACLRR